MFAILAVLFFAAAVLVHGGFASTHSHWFGWQGLMLTGLLFLALTAFTPPSLRLPRRKPEQ